MSARFFFLAWVDTDNYEHARQAISERLGPDEDYGFDYYVDFKDYDAPPEEVDP